MSKLKAVYSEELVKQTAKNLAKVNLYLPEEIVEKSETVSKSISEIQDFIAVAKKAGQMKAVVRFLEECLGDVLAVEYSKKAVRNGLNRLSAFSEALRSFESNDYFDGFGLRHSFYGSSAGTLLEEVEDSELFETLGRELRGRHTSLAEAFPVFPGMVLREEALLVGSAYRKSLPGALTEASAVKGGLSRMVGDLKILRRQVLSLGPGFKRIQEGLKAFTARVQNAATGGLKVSDNPQRVMAQIQLVLNMFRTLAKVTPDIVELFDEVLRDLPNSGGRYHPDNKEQMDRFQAVLKRELNGNFSDKIKRLFGRKNVIFPSEINPDMLIEDILDVLEAPDSITEGLNTLVSKIEALSGKLPEPDPALSSEPVAKQDQVSSIPKTQTTAVDSSAPPQTPQQVDYAADAVSELLASGLDTESKRDLLHDLAAELLKGVAAKQAFQNLADAIKASTAKRQVIDPGTVPANPQTPKPAP
jgi:hypothetical protein